MSDFSLMRNAPSVGQPTGIPGKYLFEWLGYFWKRIFKDREIVRTQFQGEGIGVAQMYLNYIEWINSQSVKDIPVLHRELWHPFTVKRSQLGTGAAALLKYGDGAVYGPQRYDTAFTPGAEFIYGGQASFKNVQAFPCPADIAAIGGVIVDTPVSPKVVFSPGRDFIHSAGAIVFFKDPFSLPDVATRNILDEKGDVVDTEIMLWIADAMYDIGNLSNQFGIYFQASQPSSAFFQQLLERLWFTCREGSSDAMLTGLLAAMAGLPFVKNSSEIVEKILTRPEDQAVQIVTDKEVYTFPAGSTPIVTVGQTVTEGMVLTDSVLYLDSHAGVEWWRNELYLQIGSNLIDFTDYSAEIVANNIYSPITIKGQSMSGKNLVEFQLHGQTADVDKFWQFVRDQEASTGIYLSDAIGSSGNINPLEFIFQNFLSANYAILRVKIDKIVTPDIFDAFLPWFRKLFPSHVSLLIFRYQTVGNDPYSMDAIIDPLAPYGADDTIQNMLRGVAPDVLQSNVVENAGIFTELTYKEGACLARSVPGCD